MNFEIDYKLGLIEGHNEDDFLPYREMDLNEEIDWDEINAE